MTTDADRHVSPYTSREKIARMLWSVVQATLFRLSFHNCYGWRRFLLRRFGASIGRDCVIRRSVRIECPWNLTMADNACLGDRVNAYCLGTVTLGRRVSVSQDAELCAGSHDYTTRDMPLLRPPILIKDDVWIAAGAFVGPGVTVGEGAVLGARGVAMKDLESWSIHVGNPAIRISDRQHSS
jgi:putative colanic acid biosynthesis acetyltransferase WcaF